MTEHNMKHLMHLEDVTESDVAVLRRKEATYQGSWKRAGGRSAWFMARRNMDRLIEMMRKPDDPPTWNMQNVQDTIEAVAAGKYVGKELSCEFPGTREATAAILTHLQRCYVAENIFAKIRERPNGEDGTVLACMRDLRRYLILVEAEMISRGVVVPEEKKNVGNSIVDMMLDRRVPRYELKGSPRNAGPVTIDEEPLTYTDGRPVYAGELRPDADESRHASLAPWQMTEIGGDFLLREFYRHVSPKIFRLEPFVNSEKIPRQIAHCYELSDRARDTWVLRLADLPEELREYYPRLQLELNAKEHEEHPQPYMYYLCTDEKYRLQVKYVTAGWGRELD